MPEMKFTVLVETAVLRFPKQNYKI